MMTITETAVQCGILEEEVQLYGRNKAKISLKALDRLKNAPQGKLILVTAISPTPAGEGKTVTTIGIGDSLRRIGLRSTICIREPSLGPVFGIKGGGAGGGKCQADPAHELNLHFTGDSHAVAAAHNLLAAIIEAHIYHGNSLEFDPHSVCWDRVLDVTDRALRKVVVGLGGKANGTPRETDFAITAASEIMALLSMTSGYADLKRRLSQIVVGISRHGEPITTESLHATGALAVLLRDAVQPNFIRTLEGTPLFAHTGPFGNIATGCNSVLADMMALRTADYVVTEAGFGADLGFEKFCHIVSPALGKSPDAVALVATVRGLKAHSGRFKLIPGKPLPPDLFKEDLQSIRGGVDNLAAHIGIIHKLGLPVVVVINRFPTDSQAELKQIQELACQNGADGVAVSSCFELGSEGGEEMAHILQNACELSSNFQPVYSQEAQLIEKIHSIATEIYGAGRVRYEAGVKTRLHQFEKWGYGRLPICFAKTQYSLTHDPALKGAPKDFTLPIVSVQLAAGAGFIKVFCGDIMTMPGLGAQPSALRMDITDAGDILGVS